MYQEDFTAGITSGRFELDPNDPINDGVIVHWPMNEGRGNVARDISGNSKNAAFAGFAAYPWARGPQGSDGQALLFSTIGNMLQFSQALTDFSISFWLYWSTTGSSGYGTIFTNASSTFGVFINAGALQYYDLANRGASSALTANTWYPVVVTRVSATGAGTFYLNGNAAGTFSGSSTGSKTFDRTGQNSVANTDFGGRLWNFRVHNRILKPKEAYRLASNKFAGLIIPEAPFHEDVYLVAVGGDPTGTAAQTLKKIAQAGSGSQIVAGTAVSVLGRIRQAGAGAQIFTGLAAQTLPSIDQNASGTQIFTGLGAQTLPSIDQTASGSQSQNAAGAVAQTLPSIDQIASGTQTQNVTGIVVQTLPSIDQAASGAQFFTGAIASALKPIVQTASGAQFFTGAVASVLKPVMQAAVGVLRFVGTAASTLPSVDQAITGQAITGQEFFSGSAALILAKIRQTVAGTVTAPVAPVVIINPNFLVRPRARVRGIAAKPRVAAS